MRAGAGSRTHRVAGVVPAGCDNSLFAAAGIAVRPGANRNGNMSTSRDALCHLNGLRLLSLISGFALIGIGWRATHRVQIHPTSGRSGAGLTSVDDPAIPRAAIQRVEYYCPTARLVLDAGSDGQPGVAGVDDANNGIVDDPHELGATGSDDRLTVQCADAALTAGQRELARGGWCPWPVDDPAAMRRVRRGQAVVVRRRVARAGEERMTRQRLGRLE